MQEEKAIRYEYQQYISYLNNVKESLENLKGGRNSQFTEIQRGFIQTLEEEIQVSTTEMEKTLNGTVWDKLTIAFLGETNAGKSTIIETFRILYDKDREQNTDGKIVGDGRSDFTQSYEEYNLEIEGRPFILIDVPGIEGNEKVYADDIKKALRRAHIVFYVHGHNIKPNIATAEKIKAYLGDWVNVYTLYNVRGSVSNYDEEEERTELYTNTVIDSEKLIVSTFKDVLGDFYKGNITLQALLAMCAYAKFAPERVDLARNQQKLLNFFGAPEQLLKFSEFYRVQELVCSKSANYLDEIVGANNQKMYSMTKRAAIHLQNTVDSLSEKTVNFENTLKTFKRDITESFSSCKINIKKKTRAEVDTRMFSLRRRIDNIIDDSIKDKKERAEKASLDEMKILSNNIECIVANEINNLREKIKQKKRRLDAEYGKITIIPLQQVKGVSHMSFDRAMSKLDINIGDCVDCISSIIAGASVGSHFTIIAPGIATAIGSIAGLGLYSLRKYIFGDGGKSEAKEETRKSISDATKKLYAEVNKITNKIGIDLDSKKCDINKTINHELNDLREIGEIISEAKTSILSFANNIKY